MLIQLALKQLLREWRSGELYILFFALIIAVAAVSSVNFFTDRVHNALESQANELLGADLVLSSDHIFSENILQEAKKHNLSVVKQVTFPTMVMTDDGNQLAWLKAVESGFPLRGKLGTSEKLFGVEKKVEHMVQPGNVWFEPRLMTSLKSSIGSKVKLGVKDFTVNAILTSEPGRGGDLFTVAPRVLMNIVDLEETKLIQPGSRVRYALLIAGESPNVEVFRETVEGLEDPSIRVQGVRDARPEIRTALSRAEQFLGLAAITSVVLASIAIGLSARRFAQRHLDHCAIMRCVGATQQLITQLYLVQILVLGLIASLIGVLVGYFSHELLITLLGSFVGVTLPSASYLPAALGILTGVITLIGFAFPPIISLKDVPALRVLKRDLGTIDGKKVINYLVGFLALGFVILLQARDIKLGLYMLAGLIVTVITLALSAYLLLLLLKTIKPSQHKSWWFGLRNIIRRPVSSVVQMIAFGLGIMALLVLGLIRGDLLDEWHASIPEDAPNRFIVNIHPDQVEELKANFAQANLPQPMLYPMIRARLTEINGKFVDKNSYSDQRAKQMIAREFNMSWAQSLPHTNEILSGKWWSSEKTNQGEISIEKSVSDYLDIHLNDVVKFTVANQAFQGEVTSIRSVDWNSFSANFYVLAQPGMLKDFPTTYMTPFYLSSQQSDFLNQLVKKYPNITVIDVAVIMAHVRKIISRVTSAVEYVFLFTLLSGLMVLYSGIIATEDERSLESAVIRTLGGNQRQIFSNILGEFVSLGLLAGLIAAVMASIVAALIAQFVLKMPVSINMHVWALGLIGGGIGIGFLGFLGSLKILTLSPLAILRRVSAA